MIFKQSNLRCVSCQTEFFQNKVPNTLNNILLPNEKLRMAIFS